MWSNEFINIPFVDKGRDWDGADCWGLARIIYQEKLGIILPTLLDYEHCRHREDVAEVINKTTPEWAEIPLGEEQEFDIVVFRMMGLPSHIGIVCKRGVMIHCERDKGTYLSHYVRDRSWNSRILGFYRYAPNS